MALKRKGRAPAAKAKSEPVAEASEISVVNGATAKLTVSIKRRMANGDEVFIAPGVEMHCAADELDETQATVTERVHKWMDELLQAYPDADPLDDEDDEADDEEDEADEDDEEDEEDEDDLSEADVKKMKKAELLELIEEEELEIETKGMSVADLKAAIIEELFSEEDEEDEDEEDADDEDEDDEDEEGYTEEELAELDLKDLQEIVDAWELDHPKFKKGVKLAAKKKAYIALIIEAQDEDEE
jgi:hypothetical protein